MSVVQENPPMFMSCIQGSFSQNNPRFGDSVGKQCACNTLTSICWSVNRRVKIWKTSDLDFLLTKGDELFKVVNINRSLYFDELPKEFELSGIDFKVEFSRVDNGFWRDESNCFDIFLDDDLFFSENTNGALSFLQGYTISLLKDNETKNIYVFDSHSRPSPEGKSILMVFSFPHEVIRYILETYKNTTHILMVYVKVHPLEDKQNKLLLKAFSQYKKQIQTKAGYQILSIKRKRQFKENYVKNAVQRKEQFKENYVKNAVQRKEQSKENYVKNVGQRKEQFKENYPANLEKRKNQFKIYTKTKNNTNKVQHFKLAILQGPYFVCVSCNRSLYKRSVKIFIEEKYGILYGKNLSSVSSFDSCYYICNTCDKKLSKNQIPAQCVLNELELYDFPDHLRNINKLERVLISQRILFSKISIMPKGQFPKIKGTICNIPVKIESICETLPRTLNESNMLFIKLKKKLSFKSHVFSESVRPDLIFQILNCLKSVNPLYNNINIKHFSENTDDLQINFIDNNEIDFIIANKHRKKSTNHMNGNRYFPTHVKILLCEKCVCEINISFHTPEIFFRHVKKCSDY